MCARVDQVQLFCLAPFCLLSVRRWQSPAAKETRRHQSTLGQIGTPSGPLGTHSPRLRQREESGLWCGGLLAWPCLLRTHKSPKLPATRAGFPAVASLLWRQSGGAYTKTHSLRRPSSSHTLAPAAHLLPMTDKCCQPAKQGHQAGGWLACAGGTKPVGVWPSDWSTAA